MSSNITIYHNPRCSKSRQTLALLEEHEVQPIVVEYLKSPPSKTELEKIIKLLGLPVQDVLRKKESAYSEHGLDNPKLTEDDILNAVLESPILLERPIVVTDTKAAIGRPPENVLEII